MFRIATTYDSTALARWSSRLRSS